MQKKETIFDYFVQIGMIFGFTIICLNIFCLLFGEIAKEDSTMFAFGREGLSVATMLQFFAMAVIITTLKFLFFTDALIKKASVTVRTVAMFASVLLLIVVFAVCFGWFPVTMWQAWAMFFLCFGISVAASTIICVLKEKSENRKLEEALERLKQGENI